jgi:hypothetical protein
MHHSTKSAFVIISNIWPILMIRHSPQERPTFSWLYYDTFLFWSGLLSFFLSFFSRNWCLVEIIRSNSLTIRYRLLVSRKDATRRQAVNNAHGLVLKLCQYSLGSQVPLKLRPPLYFPSLTTLAPIFISAANPFSISPKGTPAFKHLPRANRNTIYVWFALEKLPK